jgi:hypothetical protein
MDRFNHTQELAKVKCCHVLSGETHRNTTDGVATKLATID